MGVSAEDGGVERLTMSIPFVTIASPHLVNLDDDAELEILFATSTETWTPSIYIYDWPGTSDECVIWPQGRGDIRHSAALL